MKWDFFHIFWESTWWDFFFTYILSSLAELFNSSPVTEIVNSKTEMFDPKTH